jgi:hypothetical protein
MIRTCWELGGRQDLAGLRLRQWAHTLGYGGHFSTKPRRYSTTLTALRNARRDHQVAETLASLGLDTDTVIVRALALDMPEDELDDGTLLVIGHW